MAVKPNRRDRVRADIDARRQRIEAAEAGDAEIVARAQQASASRNTSASGNTSAPALPKGEKYAPEARWLDIDLVHPMGSGVQDPERPKRKQPRQTFPEARMQRLIRSFRKEGQLQPILVRPVPTLRVDVDHEYEIIAGERRWRAAQEAGKSSILAVVLDGDTNTRKLYRLSLIENIQREDLNPVDTGAGILLAKEDMDAELKEWDAKLSRVADYRNSKAVNWETLQAKFSDEEEIPEWVTKALDRAKQTGRKPKVTWDDVSDEVGLEERSIHYLVKIASLDPEITAVIAEHELSGRQARALTLLDDKKQQKTLIKMIVSEGLDGPSAERRAQQLAGKTKTDSPSASGSDSSNGKAAGKSGTTTQSGNGITVSRQDAPVDPLEALGQAISLLAVSHQNLQNRSVAVEANAEVRGLLKTGRDLMNKIERAIKTP